MSEKILKYYGFNIEKGLQIWYNEVAQQQEPKEKSHGHYKRNVIGMQQEISR